MKLNLLTRVFVVALSVILMSCGRSSELETDEYAAFQQSAAEQFGDSPLSNMDIHEEMREVMNELQNGILTALDSSYDQRTVASKSVFGCSPKFTVIPLGVTFTASSTCKLNGTITLKLLPLSTVVDIDVVGMKFIDRIQLDANITLGGNIAVDLVFLNGRINIKLPIIGDGIAFNGRAKLAVVSGGFQLNSRINGLTGVAGTGVALLAKVDKAAGVRDIQSCLVTGGDPNNPDAGNLKTCFKLGGG